MNLKPTHIRPGLLQYVTQVMLVMQIMGVQIVTPCEISAVMLGNDTCHENCS